MKILLFFILALFIFFSAFIWWEKKNFENWLAEGRNRILALKTTTQVQPSEIKPKLLQEYLNKVLPKDPQFHCRYARFKQEGQFRMNPEDAMTAFDAKQTVSLIAPMFSWEANMTSRGVPVKVCDRLIDGNGELEARLFGFLRVAKASGAELLRGELLRYLAELPWYPYAIANQSLIHWQQHGDSELSATISLGEVSATVQFRLKDGLIESIYVPERGRTVGSETIPTPWLGEFRQYKKWGDLLVPSYGEVSWLLPESKFTYFKGNIIDYEIFCD